MKTHEELAELSEEERLEYFEQSAAGQHYAVLDAALDLLHELGAGPDEAVSVFHSFALFGRDTAGATLTKFETTGDDGCELYLLVVTFPPEDISVVGQVALRAQGGSSFSASLGQVEGVHSKQQLREKLGHTEGLPDLEVQVFAHPDLPEFTH